MKVSKSHTYFMYITASLSRVLYNGVTNDLYSRVLQHKEGANPRSFTHKYHVNRLVYFEEFDDVNDAIAREKQVKRWGREKKIRLIESINPGWHDLFYELTWVYK